MILRPGCPDTDRLRSLVEGTLPPADQTSLTEHLETCEDCQRSLETLAAPAESWAAARMSGNASKPPDPPLAQLLEKCQGDSWPNPDEGGGAELPADFLDPPERPDALGRLDTYDILEVTGRGGMGIVLKVFDRTLHRVVAIKVLAPQLAASASGRKRFVREAQAAAAVRDQHVVDIHAVGEHKGLPYLVMEFIAGISLQTKIERSAPLAVADVLRIGIQTAAGLAAAHAHGLIHRDIKPANILLENGVERVKITDFGLARVADDSSLTGSGVVAGTPQYMAPEQARGEPVDHRADLFSLGSVLYTLCTGHPPFRASGNMATLKRVCDDTPRSIREVNPDIPDWLAAVVERLHAKDPAARFQSAAEVSERLANGLAHTQEPGVVPAPKVISGSRDGRVGTRQRWYVAVASLLAAVALAVVAWPHVLEWMRKKPPEDRKSRDLAATTITEVRRFDAGHTDHIVGLAFSPDGKRAASSSVDQTIRLWDVESGKELNVLRGHTDTVTSVAFTNDGRRLLSATREGDKTVRLWDVETATELQRLGEHQAEVRNVAVSPDGRFALTAELDNTIRMYDLETGNEVRQFLGHDRAVYDATFSHDGKWVLSGGEDRTMRLWDAQTGQQLKRFDGHTDLVHGVAFSPDDRQAASAGWDGTVRLWDIQSRRELRSYRGLDRQSNRVLFTPDNFRLLSINTEILWLWDAESEREIARINGNLGWMPLAMSRDGLLVLTATPDHRVRLLRLSAGQPAPEPSAQ